VGGRARVKPPIKIMIEDKKINGGPTTYEEWYELGHTIIPCQRGTPEIKSWSSVDLKITKEEWKQKYSDCEIALRLDKVIDLDIDNRIAKRFVEKYIISCGAISGRPRNPKSHYWWKGQLEKAAFSLPKDLIKYYEHAPHGATLCEIRSGHQYYTIVPGSLHSKDPEHVRWEHYNGIREYSGDLNKDLRKIALSTALCILYAPKGSRDEYCTAIAGVLVKQTKWNDDEINDFIYNIAVAANDDEAESRKSKGTTGRESNRKFGMPKLAEILECSIQTIAHLFSWIGAEDKSLADVKVIADQSIGDIIEYGQDRYKVPVTGKLEGKIFKKIIKVDGPTLMNQKAFYDAVMSQSQVWIPKMKATDFETIMRMKFETRKKSEHYEKEANEDLVFVKHFTNYIKQEKAFTDKKELAFYGLPWFNKPNNSLEFKLDKFEDYLQSQKVNLKRVDLVLNIQDILKGKKVHGKYQEKSLVSWRIDNPDLENEDIVLEGEYSEKTEAIDFEKDKT
jgi:uncharacterized protein involved in tolerance to divalent cations